VSYVITVERPSGTPLTEGEMLEVLSNDPDFVRVESASWQWRNSPQGIELFINLSENNLWTDGGRGWTTESAIAKLQQLAARLNSRIVGEEGEDLTEVSAPAQGRTGVAAGAGVLLTLLFLPLVLLFAIIRLPWLLWTVARKK
jgi:hypothetical protein